MSEAVTKMQVALVQRTVAESQSERSEIVFPADANALGITCSADV